MGDLTLQSIIEKLYKVYKDKGFVSEDYLFEILTHAQIPLYDVDYICDQLLSMGVIIQGNLSGYINEDNDDDEYDRSQTDYEAMYDEVLSIDQSLAPFLEQVRQIKPPQHREWRILLPQAKSGNQYAYQRITLMYLRNVVKIALSYHKKIRAPLSETIQEGCIGLMVAIDKYEVGRQDVFLTYFPWWVRQYILRRIPFTINPSVYFPVHVKDKLNSIYGIVLDHQCHECRENEICQNLLIEIENCLECSSNDAEQYLRYYQGYESIEEILSVSPITFSDNGNLEDDFLDSFCYNELKLIISKTLNILTPKQRKVLQLRFGLIDGRERTLEQVGSCFGLTRERIRQIEAKALRRLQHPTRINHLRPYWSGQEFK